MKFSLIYVISAVALMYACTASDENHDALKSQIEEIAAKAPGQVGVAVIYGTDTLTINNSEDYPLMSMFKLHEAIAVCHTLEKTKAGLDTTLIIKRNMLDHGTWSPMLKDYAADSFHISAGKLVEYILIDSDNNASNILFDSIVSVAATDSIISEILPGRGFRLSHTEAEMQKKHELSYKNATSPLAYASLVNRVFSDSIMSHRSQSFIIQLMYDCNTGMSRIATGLPDSVAFAHRTGSGYVNERGEVVAVNDGGYVSLPDGRAYSIAILVKDYAGPQEDAEKVISEISKTIYKYISDYGMQH